MAKSRRCKCANYGSEEDEGDCSRTGTKSGRVKRGELDGTRTLPFSGLPFNNTRTPRHAKPRHPVIPPLGPSSTAHCTSFPSLCFVFLTIRLIYNYCLPVGRLRYSGVTRLFRPQRHCFAGEWNWYSPLLGQQKQRNSKSRRVLKVTEVCC